MFSRAYGYQYWNYSAHPSFEILFGIKIEIVRLRNESAIETLKLWIIQIKKALTLNFKVERFLLKLETEESHANYEFLYFVSAERSIRRIKWKEFNTNDRRLTLKLYDERQWN